MRTPLLSIRIRHSESPALHAGQQFDTIADFDATLGAARRSAPAASRVEFVLTWKDGASFHGRLDIDPLRPEGLVPYVTSACREALREPRVPGIVDAARLTVMRLYTAAVAEIEAVASRPSAPRRIECQVL